jgi:hypothetical protein
VPTYEETERLWREYPRLNAEQQAAFKRAVKHFVADLEEGQFRAGLRVMGNVGMPPASGCPGRETGNRSLLTGTRQVLERST